uniref:ARAD1C07282p n=1 Tax=Blastobotrys adeninivorans TaxID=409370 RepID=A0A060T0F8_BLAAD
MLRGGRGCNARQDQCHLCQLRLVRLGRALRFYGTPWFSLCVIVDPVVACRGPGGCGGQLIGLWLVVWSVPCSSRAADKGLRQEGSV